MLRVVARIVNCVWFAVPQPTEWQHIGNPIDAVMFFALADFVSLDALKQPDVPKRHRTKVSCAAVGDVGKIIVDYVIRRLNALSAD